MIFGSTAAPVLDRYEDLNCLLAVSPAPPQQLNLRQYDALSAVKRREFNKDRLDYLAGGLTVATPQVHNLIKKVRLAILGNRGRASGRTGVMISGQSTVGKTTACVALMRYVYAMYSMQFPGMIERGSVPVAYVEVPAGSSAKAVIGRFAHFYGLELPRRCTLEEILSAVVTVMRSCSTQVVVVDELQNLSRVSRGNGESVDVLKSLSNQVPATFVYSGINIHEGGLLAGERGSQISRRFSLVEMRSSGRATSDEIRVWNGIVMAFSRELPLLNQDDKALLNDAAWLHQRSAGNIGTLQRILVGGAQLLIADGKPEQETLTREFMAEIPVDIATDLHGAALDLRSSNRKVAV